MAPVSILGAGNMEQMEMDLQGMFEKIMPKPTPDPPADRRARPGPSCSSRRSTP